LFGLIVSVQDNEGAVIVVSHAPVVLSHQTHDVLLNASEQARRQLLVLTRCARSFHRLKHDSTLSSLVLKFGLLEQLEAASVESFNTFSHLQGDAGLRRALRVRLHAEGEISGQLFIQIINFGFVRSPRGWQLILV